MKSAIDTSPITEEKQGERSGSGYGIRSLPAGVKLGLCVACSFCAFVARTPLALVVLTGVNLLLFIGFRIGPFHFRREIKVFVWQTLIILGLYGFRFGLPQGLVPGLITSVQLFLAFFPGVVFIQTTPQSRIVKSFSKVMSSQSVFVLTMSIRFMPLVLKDIKTIYEAQVFRGAKILPKDLVNPLNWRDVIHCLIFPVTVHCMVMANEIALAAKARDFMRYPNRTVWSGN